MKKLKLLAIEIINLCNDTLEKGESPNNQIIGSILKEFKNILKTIETQNKINILNSKGKLGSTYTILDCAEIGFDKELFSKVYNFEKLCKKSEGFIITQHN